MNSARVRGVAVCVVICVGVACVAGGGYVVSRSVGTSVGVAVYDVVFVVVVVWLRCSRTFVDVVVVGVYIYVTVVVVTTSVILLCCLRCWGVF